MIRDEESIRDVVVRDDLVVCDTLIDVSARKITSGWWVTLRWLAAPARPSLMTFRVDATPRWPLDTDDLWAAILTAAAGLGLALPIEPALGAPELSRFGDVAWHAPAARP